MTHLLGPTQEQAAEQEELLVLLLVLLLPLQQVQHRDWHWRLLLHLH
jgi:hypothetical protein